MSRRSEETLRKPSQFQVIQVINLCLCTSLFSNASDSSELSGVFSLNHHQGCHWFNPLSPGVLDPGNYPGGPQDPQLYFGFLRLFYAP